ncbi:alkylation response protein AidB-like acyl-CoA dehydrogenase [Micromonospora luteifusca]|uniref:Alkylation response protein AidB-like acyl-CoA dehydrogenase n=1 Tax=Micromonospora luteifusca TaxID=709860 RepID=A0ABS2LMG6_9ACTN|nr:acyl-CoA dehydrogenase [Micromonospora luteifusca]MBM7489376.1 alkylation response protein AidB-like acyl-CoA dehydrogenase [Micromonospora luteifusca]
MADVRADLQALVTDLIAGHAGEWDRRGEIPVEVIRKAGAAGVLCAQVGTAHGGPGLSSVDNGELTAYTGGLCSSFRSLMTSQGMAAWTISRLGDAGQQREWLARLTGGELAAVAFSEPNAGSDLSAMDTLIERDGDHVTVTGAKRWVTGAAYADVVLVFGRYGAGAAAILVPTTAPGVTVTRVPDPLGCRAAGHADVRLDAVRLPAASLLRGAGQPLSLLVTTALTYGRISVAWGCAGIMRACLAASAAHATTRQQFGVALADHQLIARHLAEQYVAEQTATRLCAHASAAWDANSPELVTAAVVAKHRAAGDATRVASSAVQVLASAGAQDGHVVARAHRDAKLMEVIEGTNEICQLLLAEHVLATAGGAR